MTNMSQVHEFYKKVKKRKFQATVKIGALFGICNLATNAKF